jgi:prepilin-type processing-associated H-X9-DG protein
LEENLRTVDGEIQLPGGIFPRKMTLVRLADGRIVIHSAIPLAEADMHEIECWGEPAFCLIPNQRHRLDASSFQQRYPKLKILCPTAARTQVERVVRVDGGYDQIPAELEWRTLALRGDEAVFVVHSGGRATLLFADGLFNLAHLPGVFGLVLRLIGSSGGPRVSPLMKLVAATDRTLLAEQYRELAAIPGLVRLIPGHGANIEDEAAAILRDVAARI